jgi:hypothetical protein
MNPWIVLNLEFELMPVAPLRDEEYVQQAVNGYSFNAAELRGTRMRDPLLSFHRQLLHWIFSDCQEI